MTMRPTYMTHCSDYGYDDTRGKQNFVEFRARGLWLSLFPIRSPSTALVA
jgi:hypothetical protein